MAGKKQNPRKASGSGPAAIQKEERVRKVRKLLKWVFPLLDVEKIEQSGDIWPRGNLKKRDAARLFNPWIHKCAGRWFTHAVRKCLCKRIVEKLGFQPPRDPKSSYQAYICSQAARLKDLVRQAKKMSWVWCSEIHVCLAGLRRLPSGLS